MYQYDPLALGNGRKGQRAATFAVVEVSELVLSGPQNGGLLYGRRGAVAYVPMCTQVRISQNV